MITAFILLTAFLIFLSRFSTKSLAMGYMVIYLQILVTSTGLYNFMSSFGTVYKKRDL